MHVATDRCPCGHVATALTGQRAVRSMHEHVKRSHASELEELQAQGRGFRTGPLEMRAYRIRTATRQLIAA